GLLGMGFRTDGLDVPGEKLPLLGSPALPIRMVRIARFDRAHMVHGAIVLARKNERAHAFLRIPGLSERIREASERRHGPDAGKDVLGESVEKKRLKVRLPN